jgi:hypothetical protein
MAGATNNPPNGMAAAATTKMGRGIMAARARPHSDSGTCSSSAGGASRRASAALAPSSSAAGAPCPPLLHRSQNGYLSSRGGCPNRWHSLVSCDHGDPTASRFDSPGLCRQGLRRGVAVLVQAVHEVREGAHVRHRLEGGARHRQLPIA